MLYESSAEQRKRTIKASVSGGAALLLLFVIGLALLLVPPPFSTLLLVGLVIGMLAIGYVSLSAAQRHNLRTRLHQRFAWLRALWRALVWLRARYGRALSLALTVIAGAALLAATYSFRPDTITPFEEAAAQFWLGGLLLGLAIWLWGDLPAAGPRPRLAPLSAERCAIHWPLLLLGIAGLALLLWLSTRPFEAAYDRLPLDVHGQMALWVLSIGLVARGLSGVRSDDTKNTHAGKPLRARLRWLWLDAQDWLTRARLLTGAALLAVLLLALALRTYDLEMPHRWIDESHWFDAVPRIWDYRDSIRIFYPFSDTTAFTWIYPYGQWLFVATLGASFTAMRLLSAVFGTLGVAALYLLARALFDKPTALLAALLLAAFPPHIQFSRIALNNIADPLFGTLALALLVYALRSGRRVWYVLAGVCLGLTQYFYEGGRLLYPPLLALFTLLWLFSAEKTPAEPRGQSVRNLALLAVCAALIAAPVYLTLVNFQLPLTVRLQAMGFGDDYWTTHVFSDSSRFRAQFVRVLLGYIHLPETGWFYAGQTPLLLTFVVPFFLLGVWQAIWRLRRAGMLLLALWLAVATVGISLTRDLWSARYVVVFPALALLVALGLRLTLTMLAPLFGWLGAALRDDDAARDTRPVLKRRYTRLVLALSVGVALLLSAAQIRYYFGEHLPYYNTQFRPGPDVYDALFRAVNLPYGTQVHILSNSSVFIFDIAAIARFWNRHQDLAIELVPLSNVNEHYFVTLPRQRGHAFFIEPGDTTSLTLIMRYFAIEPPRISPYGVPPQVQFILYYVPPGAGRNP